MTTLPLNQIQWPYNTHRNYEVDFSSSNPMEQVASVAVPILQALYPQNIFSLNIALNGISAHTWTLRAFDSRTLRNIALSALSLLAAGLSFSHPAAFAVVGVRDFVAGITAFRYSRSKENALLLTSATCNLLFIATGLQFMAAACALSYAGKKMVDMSRYKAQRNQAHGNNAILPSLLRLASIAVAGIFAHRGLLILTFRPLRPPHVPLS